MNLMMQPCGIYKTNCYLLSHHNHSLVIDPGVGAKEWITQLSPSLRAIILTHGHFDHVWDVQVLSELYNIPVYIHAKDLPLCQKDIVFSTHMTPFTPTHLIKDETPFTIDDFTLSFWNFGGHTPGTSIVEINGYFFSGDFLFKHSIGRTDFPLSDPEEMKKSLQRFQVWDKKGVLYPGHGETTTIDDEKSHIDTYLRWLN